MIRFVELNPDNPREGIAAIDFSTADTARAGTSQNVLGVTLRFVT